MNNCLNYAVCFNYSEEIPQEVKDYVEEEFVKVRNIAIDLLNPHYEEWNAEYDDVVNGEDDKKYNAFIRTKQNEILNEVNNHICRKSLVKLYSDEHCDLVGVFRIARRRRVKTVKMHMSLKPMN